MMTDTFLTTTLSWLEAGSPEDVLTLYRQDEVNGTYGIETRIEKQLRFP